VVLGADVVTSVVVGAAVVVAAEVLSPFEQPVVATATATATTHSAAATTRRAGVERLRTSTSASRSLAR
jgi:hypothetical protein